MIKLRTAVFLLVICTCMTNFNKTRHLSVNLAHLPLLLQLFQLAMTTMDGASAQQERRPNVLLKSNDPSASLMTSIASEQIVDPLAEMKFCLELVENCPFLKHKQLRPVTQGNSRVKLNATLGITRFIELNDLHHRFSIQAQFEILWQMPSCAVWNKTGDDDKDDDFLQVTKTTTTTSQPMLLPFVPFCQFDSIWKPTLIHSNQVGQGNVIHQ